MNHWLFLCLMILPTSDLPAKSAEVTQTNATTSQTASVPEAAVKKFYRWYIDRLNKNIEPLRQEKTALRNYFTPEFLRNAPKLLEQTNADVFICAQDWDRDWGRNPGVSRLNMQGAVATKTVTLSGKTIQNHRLKVKMRQIDGAWKIDKTEPLNL